MEEAAGSIDILHSLSPEHLEIPNDEKDCVFFKIDLSDPVTSLRRSAESKPSSLSMWIQYIEPFFTLVEDWKVNQKKKETWYVIVLLLFCTSIFAASVSFIYVFQDCFSFEIATWIIVALYIISMLMLGLLWMTRGQLTRAALIDLINDFNQSKISLNPVEIKLNEYANFIEVHMAELHKDFYPRSRHLNYLNMRESTSTYFSAIL